MPLVPKAWEYWFRQVLLSPVIRAARPLLYAAAFVWRRLLFRTTFIVVTGSVGKTTTKECLAGILEAHAPTFRTWRNLAATQVLSLNLLRVRPWHRYAVIEIAIGAPGQMEAAARLARPDVAIILNAFPTHADQFRDSAQHAREKCILLRHLSPRGLALLGREDPQIAALAGELPQTVRYFGVDGECDYRAEQIVAAWPGRLGFVLRCPSGTFDVRTQLVGEHWVSTALAALAGADAVGVDMAAAVRKLARVPPFPGRFQPMKIPSSAIFLRDDYGGAFVTTKKALRVMETATAKRRWLLISDFTCSSMNRRKRLKYLAEQSRSAADVVVLIGDQAAWGRRRVIDAGFSDDNVHAFSTIREAADLFQRELTNGDLVLLKGRVTQHLARIYFAQLGPVKCWKEYCPKTMLCDICWELGMKPADMELGKVVVPGEATGEDGGRI